MTIDAWLDSIAGSAYEAYAAVQDLKEETGTDEKSEADKYGDIKTKIETLKQLQDAKSQLEEGYSMGSLTLGDEYMVDVIKQGDRAVEYLEGEINTLKTELDTMIWELFGDVSTNVYDVLMDGATDADLAIENLKAKISDFYDWADKERESRAEQAESKDNYNGMLEDLYTAYAGEGEQDASKLSETLFGYDPGMIEGLSEEYSGLAVAMAKAFKELDAMQDGTGDAKAYTKALRDLSDEFDRARTLSGKKYFKDTTKSIYQLEDGLIDVSEAYEQYYKEADKGAKAQEEYDAAVTKFAENEEVAASEVATLAEVLKYPSAEMMLNNWDAVGSQIQELSDEASPHLTR